MIRQRKADMRRQRDLEEAEREERRDGLPMSGDEPADAPDDAPPGWARS